MSDKDKTKKALEKNKPEGAPDRDADAKDDTAPRGRLRRLLLPALLVLVLAGCGATYFVYAQNTSYFKTDNARVTAKMYSVYAVKAGELLEWDVKLGDEVAKDQILGRQDVLPYITSPIAGLVVKNDVTEGQSVTPGTPLAIIADMSDVYIGVNIEETDIVGIAVGQAVDVKIDAYKGRTFKGEITEIDQTTQTYFGGSMSLSTSGTYTKVTQLIPVKVHIENKENLALTFGMNATVKIYLKEYRSGESASAGGGAATETRESVYTAGVEAGETMKVSPNVSGRVQTLAVAPGDRVKRGDVLFTLDASDIRLQLRQADASVGPSGVAYAEAGKTYERMRILFAEGAVSQTELDSARVRLETSRSQYDGARAARDIIRQKIEDCTVKAPMDGRVLSVGAKVGDVVSQQPAPITLINDDTILLHISVPENRISGVREGAPAEITLRGTGSKLSGLVRYVAPGANADTGMFEVEIGADNAAGLAEAGMTAEVRL